MKRKIKIVIQTIFLLAVIFCVEKNGYTNSNILQFSLEYITGTQVEENCYISDDDLFDDEQINPSFELLAGNDTMGLIPSPQYCILIYKYTALIWQPPKYKIVNHPKSLNYFQPIKNYVKS